MIGVKRAKLARIGAMLLMAAGLSLLGTSPAIAGGSLPEMPSPNFGTATASSSASTSIVAHEPPPQLLPPALPRVGSTAAVDGEGRNLSVSLPSKVTLYGLARAETVDARMVLTPAGAGTAKLALALDRPVPNARTAGDYVGILRVTLDYN